MTDEFASFVAGVVATFVMLRTELPRRNPEPAAPRRLVGDSKMGVRRRAICVRKKFASFCSRTSRLLDADRECHGRPIPRLFACLGSLRFSEPMPASDPVPITGIHFAIEQGPARNTWRHVALDSVSLLPADAVAAR